MLQQHGQGQLSPDAPVEGKEQRPQTDLIPHPALQKETAGTDHQHPDDRDRKPNAHRHTDSRQTDADPALEVRAIQ